MSKCSEETVILNGRGKFYVSLVFVLTPKMARHVVSAGQYTRDTTRAPR
jgi:hypothetical protein